MPVSVNPSLYEPLTADNAAMILIDHQTGTMLAVQDIKLSEFRSNVLALAKTAKLHKLPTVLTDSYAIGPNGPLMAELPAMFPEAAVVHRPGPINAWDDPEFVKAVKATGRKKLIMAGVTIDVCLMYPALSALKEGFEVYAVYDASGAWDSMSEMVAIQRLQQAGAVVLNWTAVTAQLQSDWRREATAGGTLEIFHEHQPFYGFLMNNLAAAQAATKG
jgi:nicotinamidase-related amidase